MKRDAIDVVCNLTALDLFERDVKKVYFSEKVTLTMLTSGNIKWRV